MVTWSIWLPEGGCLGSTTLRDQEIIHDKNLPNLKWRFTFTSSVWLSLAPSIWRKQTSFQVYIYHSSPVVDVSTEFLQDMGISLAHRTRPVRSRMQVWSRCIWNSGLHACKVVRVLCSSQAKAGHGLSLSKWWLGSFILIVNLTWHHTSKNRKKFQTYLIIGKDLAVALDFCFFFLIFFSACLRSHQISLNTIKYIHYIIMLRLWVALLIRSKQIKEFGF